MHRFDQTPSDMPTTTRPMNAGSSVNDNASRLDGPAKVTGTAKYGRDMYFAGGLYVGFLRCPFGAATLTASDEAAAKAVPGVVDVEISRKDGKYHGHKMGQVVGESPLAVKRGLRALKCQWKVGSDIKTSIRDTVESLPDIGDKAKEAIDGAEMRMEAVYTTPVQPHSCLETHGGSIELKDNFAKVYASTQGTSATTDGLSKFIEMPRSNFEVICDYVGGGFGSKLGGPGRELQAAAGVVAKHKKSAWMFADRSGDQTDTGNRPSSMTLCRVAFKKDGTITGGEIRKWGGTGVGGGGGCSIPSGRYSYKVQSGNTEDVHHNGGMTMPARAPGSPQGGFAEELMIEEIAVACGIDPLVLKKKMASRNVYREMLELGEKMIGWENRKPTGSQTGVVRIGYGVGLASWHGSGPGWDARVVVHQDGSVEALSGAQDPGTGTRTIVGIAAAAALGVPLSMVTAKIGHSGLPSGPASGGSTVTAGIAPTIELAAQNAKKQLLEAVAKNEPGLKVEELDVKDGNIVKGEQKLMGWKDACARLPADGITGKPEGKADAGSGGNDGVQFVKLAVDTETGVVHVQHVVAIQSAGRVIFRKGAESQVMGAVIQGISNALFEQQVLDRNVGTMMNDNLESYKIMGPYDMPKIETVLWTHGQTGVRGCGEPAIVPTSGAVACAIFNAIGRPVRDLPMTPDKVLAAMEGGKA